ncbi:MULTISPECIES: ImmA/IrrE family metallo-endopeptidase [Bifidobacterium]|uniref:ImmA/IrrE family metallo-endopeptidase n=1 Tax=Bifidobacterium TaxID=1678 RepID=UPI0018DDC9C6|nr:MULTISPECIES: ImmA/IrrE family metallo-endopeptidase [Bifidobacterium]MBI0145707.1 ImmA/IrrE family metallo-endopeptidase [Bifidobacterium polysaccharolyticum]MBI0152822.1 ImmA/IrrE family metallo-endopeptidase [Bifidobacterium sp. M0399]
MAQTVRVNVPRTILDWVISIGAEDRLGENQRQNIDAWKQGTKRPTVSQLHDISDKLHVPFGYFFMDEPIDDTPPIYAKRTVGSQQPQGRPSRDLVDTIDQMTAIQDWARQDRIDNEGSRLEQVGSRTINDDSKLIVEDVRRALKINKHWYRKSGLYKPAKAFKLLRERAEGTGILIMQNGVVGNNTRRPLDPQEFRAFTLIDPYAPLIFINKTDEPETARLFSLVHELAHVWLGADELYNDTVLPTGVTRLEQVCNEVAAAILLPDEDFLETWQSIPDDTTLDERMKELKKHFPVSPTALALHALKHKLISQETFQKCNQAAQTWSEETENQQGSPNFYNTELSRFDSRFLERLASSVAKGGTTYLDAYRLTGITGDTFTKLMKRAVS